MAFGVFALVAAALFTGAAFYITFAEQPVRLSLDDRAQLAQWKPAYARGYVMQANLAIAGFLLGCVAGVGIGDWRFFAGALLMIANWPFTLIYIMPTNKALDAIPVEQAGTVSRALIEKWGRLHTVRTGLGAAATVAFMLALG